MTRRGTVLLVSLSGDYGKPRPAVVVQTNLAEDFPSVVVCPITTAIRDDLPYLRVSVEPTKANGLRLPSQIMVEKLSAAPRTRIGGEIGTMEPAVMTTLDRLLAILLGPA